MIDEFDLRATEITTRLAASLARKGELLAVAESCTGGWIAKCCTDLPGSSDWFERGFVTYSNEAKHELLGVPNSVLESAGAVSAETAAAMAEGALAHSRAQVALAVTGIAGPDGGSADKPTGTVWFAWAGLGPVSTEKRVFNGGREAVRQKTVLHALTKLVELLDGG